MALFEDHIAQAKHNLQFLGIVNRSTNDYPDWQVTICFYTALHLANAHLSKHSLQYRQHKAVNYALNPFNSESKYRLPMPEYEAYMSLQRLSRRSRYLVNEKDGNVAREDSFLTYEKHVAKAFRNLDKLLVYFNNLYSLNLEKVELSCREINQSEGLKLLKFV